MTAYPSSKSIVGAAAAPLDVIVIGGGIGGLTLAQGLKKADVSVAVYERAIHGYEAEMLDYGFRAVRSSLRAMEQAIPQNGVRLYISRAMFRIVDRVPALKRWMFRGMGDE